MWELKETVCSKILYRLGDAKVPNFPPLHALNRAHGEALRFRFTDFDDNVMKKRNIEKPVLAPTEVIRLEYADYICIGHVTSISSTVHDISIIFGTLALIATT